MTENITANPILILDFGSQYTQLIARRVREMGVYCEIYPFDLSREKVEALSPAGIILSGGPSTATVLTNPKAPAWLFDLNLPLLGICYGMQTMARQLGGEVKACQLREFGYAKVSVEAPGMLLSKIQDGEDAKGHPCLDVWMSHGDQVTLLPPGFKVLCRTENAPIAGMAHEEKPWYGLQFHPEVTHTSQGKAILTRFVLEICKAQKSWVTDHIVSHLIDDIRQTVGKEKVLLALSGGVDSSVVAALLHRAIGEQLICVLIDTGLLRAQEAQQVIDMLDQHMGLAVKVISAESYFFKMLEGVQCPEEKRKKIGHAFIQQFEDFAQDLPEVKWLAQGTIYPDVIESAAIHPEGASMVIKSHHNVGGLPERLNLKLLEPIRELFKDEVRKIGIELGLAPQMVYRHPFPGPGLGVRVLGEVKREYVAILRQADTIFIEELHAAGLYSQVSQAFAVFLPVKSVGVMGDGRRYDYVICLRAVETVDFMTAHWAQLPWDFLAKVSNRIVNEVDKVSRVTYDISGKPPATIEWE